MPPRYPKPGMARVYPFSWRLMFFFDGEKLALVKQQRVAMIAPASAPLTMRPTEQTGTRVEILAEKQTLLYIRNLVDPFETRVEHHLLEGPIEVHRRPARPGALEIVVPDVQRSSSTFRFVTDAFAHFSPGTQPLPAATVFSMKLPGNPN